MVGRRRRARKGLRHRPLLHRLLKRHRRLQGFDRARLHQPRDRPALRPHLPGDHRAGHGPGAETPDRAPRDRMPRRGGGRFDGGHAGAPVGSHLPGGGPEGDRRRHDRTLDRPADRLQRGRAAGDHGRSRVGGRDLSGRSPAGAGPAARPDDRAHHLPLRRGDA